MSSFRSRKSLNYRVGIDVGTHSVGFAAVEVDRNGEPKSVLAAVSHIHDSGVLEPKYNTTRLAAAGVARRTRRLIRRRRRRLEELESTFIDLGWALPTPSNDPYEVWRARARLASARIENNEELERTLVVALRHMARHRGWRNPYVRVESLGAWAEPSAQFLAFKEKVESSLGQQFGDEVTVGELALAAIDHDQSRPLRMGKTENRGEDRSDRSYLGGKLMQHDNANEIHRWAGVQELDPGLVRQLISVVFQAESPRGSWISRVGKDPLTGEPRAPKASDTFQRFVILTTLANIRKLDGEPLSLVERTRAYEFLLNAKPGSQPSWSDIAKVIDLDRKDLAGQAALYEGQERLPQRPPTMVTNARVLEVKKPLVKLRDWWFTATGDERDALILLLVDGIENEKTDAGAAAKELLLSLDEDALSGLDSLDLPAGRSAYSLNAMKQIVDFLLGHEGDLYVARRALFDVPPDWAPPAEPINSPVGNPAVDRVLKSVNRFLSAAESRWGPPQRVVVEHVRDAFVSAESVRQRDREAQRRMEANELQRLRIKKEEKAGGRTTVADVRRYDSITRQKGQCLYCGNTITFQDAEMDHIVPRKGVGSTNTRANLAAVCVPCNRAKGNTPFATWAESSGRVGVSVEDAVGRTKFWPKDKGLSHRGWRQFLSDVADRLQRTEADPEIDGRSIESVAWMARELRSRIAAHFGESTDVFVYPGALTAGARQAAGVANRLPLFGGGEKTRLDRRHHAVDAAVLTLLEPSVAKTLTERNNLRTASAFGPSDRRDDWKLFTGDGLAAQSRFDTWRRSMDQLALLLEATLLADRVVVTEDLRLRLANGKVHDDTIYPLVRRRVSEAFGPDEIDSASTPQLWHALTRDPQYAPDRGLPEDRSRHIRIHGTRLGPNDEVQFFGDAKANTVQPLAALAVRGGWAQIGDTVHHARIYRWTSNGKVRWGMLRVFSADLLPHREKDLFAVAPERHWISVRAAHQPMNQLNFSDCEYVGWLVAGDEVRVTVEGKLAVGHVARAMGALQMPATSPWVVTGFTDGTKLGLVPRYLAFEGLERFSEQGASESELASVKVILDRWRPAVQVLFEHGRVAVVRRDALGQLRLSSRAHLPTSWDSE